MAAYVQRAATLFGAEVTLLHVCDLTSHNGFEVIVRPPTEIAEERWKLAEMKLKEFLKSEFPPETCPRVLLTGEAAAAIAATATKWGFDLIVLPTHAGRFRRLLLGSTTVKVLGDAECPVLTTQHAESNAPRSLEHRKWVCAIALHPDSERVLRYAKRAASHAGATLSVIHVIPAGHAESFSKQQARLGVANLQAAAGTDAPVRVAVGPVKEALLAMSAEASADVLVIGRSPHSGPLGRMRDLTYTLIRDSACPVVSV
jgi:nucleotide-binding universal stress UspA family protein